MEVIPGFSIQSVTDIEMMYPALVNPVSTTITQKMFSRARGADTQY
jgi:hypothetical protein